VNEWNGGARLLQASLALI